jgi:hypothetical protein
MAIHDGTRFKSMPNNAWRRSRGLHAFPVVGSRRAWPSDGENGRQATGKGKRGNDPGRWSNHCLTLSRSDRMPASDAAHSKRRPARWRRLLPLTSQITSGSVLFRESQSGCGLAEPNPRQLPPGDWMRTKWNPPRRQRSTGISLIHRGRPMRRNNSWNRVSDRNGSNPGRSRMDGLNRVS